MDSITVNTSADDIEHKEHGLVGDIQFEENTIKRIEIFPEYQGEGYGTAAIREFCEEKYSDGFEEVYVACVTSEALISILERKFDGEEVSSHTLPISPDPLLSYDKPDYKLELPLDS